MDEGSPQAFSLHIPFASSPSVLAVSVYPFVSTHPFAFPSNSFRFNITFQFKSDRSIHLIQDLLSICSFQVSFSHCNSSSFRLTSFGQMFDSSHRSMSSQLVFKRYVFCLFDPYLYSPFRFWHVIYVSPKIVLDDTIPGLV